MLGWGGGEQQLGVVGSGTLYPQFPSLHGAKLGMRGTHLSETVCQAHPWHCTRIYSSVLAAALFGWYFCCPHFTDGGTEAAVLSNFLQQWGWALSSEASSSRGGRRAWQEETGRLVLLHRRRGEKRCREAGMQAVLLSEPPAGRPGRRWALQIVCGPLPTPVSESEEHDSPHFPICRGCRLCRVGSRLMPVGPLAQGRGEG